MSEIKLTYFTYTGSAEPIRFMFAYGNVKYEDERISPADWPTLKPNTPMGQLPLLTVNGKTYFQSVALYRYVGKLVGLDGHDGLDNMEIDGIAESITNMREKVTDCFMQPDEAVKMEKKEKLENELIPFYMEKFEKFAKENSGHFACNKLTWVDFYFAGVMEVLNDIFQKDWLSIYPNLHAVYMNVMTLPAVKEWIEKRPKNDIASMAPK